MELRLRLTELLREEALRHKGWKGLAAAIWRANNGHPKRRVRRRKLADLCESEDLNVTLTLNQLRALQVYFDRHHIVPLRGNMLWESAPDLLCGFEDEGDITVFYRTRFLDAVETEVSSSWDLRAIEALMNSDGLARSTIRLQDVFHYGGARDATALRRRVQGEAWYDAIVEPTTHIVSVGSPFVSYATELLLCAMCGVERGFASLPPREGRALPFRFYWPLRTGMSDSAFRIRAEDLFEMRQGRPADFRDDTPGLLIDDQWFPAPVTGQSVNLVAAGYLAGRFVLVICGVHAPATTALAKLVAQRAVPLLLNQVSSSRPDLVTFIPVATDIEQKGGASHDARVVERSRVLDARVWDRRQMAWSAR